LETLKGIGYEVMDYGDVTPRVFQDDEQHQRARNLPEIVAGLNELRTRAELAVKTGALVLVLGGDCAQAIGLLTGARRYYKHTNLLWFDRDADLNTPATTPSGRIDGMVVAHIIGRGAPELVRLWGEPQLVREPDITLFGLHRVDAAEEEFLRISPIRAVSAADIQKHGAGAAARSALAHLHADAKQFVLHLDTDVIAQEEFSSVNVPGSGGLNFEDVREALNEFVLHENLVGLDIAQYNPNKDSDGNHARKLVDLVAGVLAKRLRALEATPSDQQSAVAAGEPVPETSTGSGA
jgi:arginase